MKPQALLLAVLVGGVAVAAPAQPADQPSTPPAAQDSAPPAPVPQPGPTNGPENQPQSPAEAQPAAPDSAPPIADTTEAQPNGNNDTGRATPARNAAAAPAGKSGGPTVSVVPPKANSAARADQSLRMNFRNAPLDMVLNYMSDAAGFIIILETELRGNVDVWSKDPLTKTEAVALLNTVLAKNNYAAIQDGRFLTIVSRDEARRRDIEIKSGNNPSEIPKNNQIVTQIIPVRSLNATQLVKDLAPLLPTDTTITANEAGNSLIMTDTQLNIHRMAEIIKALDSVSSTVNSIRVFPLAYADSKSAVTVIKELFPTQDSGSTQRAAGGRGGGGGGPFGGGFPMFGAPGGGNNANSSSQKPTLRVLATADENSNSVIVSAPDDILPLIEDLIKSIDVSVDDIAEVKVFRLQYSDPVEMASLLTSLFPDDTTSNTSNNRFGGGGGPFAMFGQQRQNGSSSQSDRAKRKGRVLAVADQRTASVVVSADKSLMPHIGTIIQQLDANPAKKQRVYVYSLENADVQDVQQVLVDLFQSSNSRNSRNSSSTQTSPLNTRSTQMQQQQNQQQSSGFGNSSSGTRGQ